LTRSAPAFQSLARYLGLTEKRYQSADTDIGMGISKQGDAMARHYRYEAANVLLTTVKKRFALRSWGLKLVKEVRAFVGDQVSHFAIQAGGILWGGPPLRPAHSLAGGSKKRGRSRLADTDRLMEMAREPSIYPFAGGPRSRAP
jgi:hypothetical protein